LAQEFGRGFEAKNLRRMVQFAQVFAEPEIAATLSRQLSWSHFVTLLPLKTEQARQFYAQQAATQTWSVRELRQQIERKAFERTELASLQASTTVQAPTAVRAEPVETLGSSPAQIFKDPDFLDFLGLRQGHDEAVLKLPSCASLKPSSWSWAVALRLWSVKSAWSLTAKTSTSTCFFTTAACAAWWPSS